MHFGVFDHLDRNDLSLRDFYDSRLEFVEAYDRAGFLGYHIAEHHSTPLGMAPSPNVFLSAVAQRTRRLRFGPLVYALPFYSPLRLVEEICMLDQMSGGRLDMGFGRGASPIEMNYHGIEFEQAEAMLREGIDVVVKGLTNRRLNHAGEHYRYDDTPIALEPFQIPHPPIWYGSSSAQSAERAAARGFNIVNLDTPEKAAPVFAAFRAALEKQPPRPQEALAGLGRFIVVAETDDAALVAARRAYPKWHANFSWLYHTHGRSPMRGERSRDFDSLCNIEGKGVAGSPATVIDYLTRQKRAVDFNYLVGQFAFGDLSREEVLTSIDLFSRYVMPALRAV